MFSLTDRLDILTASAHVRHLGGYALADALAEIGGRERMAAICKMDRPRAAGQLGRFGTSINQDASFTSVLEPQHIREGGADFLRFMPARTGDQSAWLQILIPEAVNNGLLRIVARDGGTGVPAASASRGASLLMHAKCSDDLTTFRAWGVGPFGKSGSAARRLRVVDS